MLEGRFHRSLRRTIAAHVRHQWPPHFFPPPDGHWVIVQPWEFGSLPRSWVGPMTDLVDEIWAYTSFVRDSYLSSGVPADRVHIIPLGIDPLRFHPGPAPLPLGTRQDFKFLRRGDDPSKGDRPPSRCVRDDLPRRRSRLPGDQGHGGTRSIGGKPPENGSDGSGSSRGPGDRIPRPDLGADELAGLYTACDCLVHPYRGEGFGLPIAEAMSSGLPVIVTGTAPDGFLQ